MNATVYKQVPGAVTIAEESTSWPGVTRPTHLGGLGFGFKWNMGWMHDTLDYAAREPVYRAYHHHQMTFSMVYAFSENFVLPISHDEVVHGKGSMLRKMPGDRWQQLANLRALYGYMWAHPGKQLLFMGQEFAQESEWAEGRSLDWWLLDTPDHRGMHSLVRDLNALYREQPGAVEPGHRPRRVRLDRRQRRGLERLLLPALGQRGRGAGVRDELRRHPAPRLPARAALRRRLARGAQHRRRRLRRQRGGQPRPGGGRPRSRGTASPRRRRSRCRRWRRCGSSPEARRALGTGGRMGPVHPLYAHAREARESRRLADLYGADPVLAVVGEAPADGRPPSWSRRGGGWPGRLAADASLLRAGMPALPLGGRGAGRRRPGRALPRRRERARGRAAAARRRRQRRCTPCSPPPPRSTPRSCARRSRRPRMPGWSSSVAFATRWLPGYADRGAAGPGREGCRCPSS